MLNFLDAIASSSTYPCQWVIVSDLEIAIASPSCASLLLEAINYCASVLSQSLHAE